MKLIDCFYSKYTNATGRAWMDLRFFMLNDSIALAFQARPSWEFSLSRLRPDIRLLENGDIDGAANEKNRLEEKQREARKSRKKGKEEWKPR